MAIDPVIEAIIIRGIVGEGPHAILLYNWLRNVVDEACRVRNNVRVSIHGVIIWLPANAMQPQHSGIMTQAGLNMGQRNARVLGPALSYNKKLNLSTEECVAHDSDVIGATSLFWNIIASTVPTEVTAEVEKSLEDLPRLHTRNIAEGKW